MSTELTETKRQTAPLATVDREQWLAIREGSDIAEAIEANLGAGETIDVQDLLCIKTPTGGGTTWHWTGPAGEEQAKTIDGLLVHCQMCGLLWPTADPAGLLPLLRTDDLLEAYRVGSDPGDIDLDELEKYRLANGRYDWPNLPWNQWNTGRNGVGKRCKEQRLLFLLRKDDAWPTLIRAGVGSLRTVRPFVKRLAVPMWRACVSLGLVKQPSKAANTDYAQIVPRYLGAIGKEDGEIVRRRYTEPLRRMVRIIPAERDVEE